jgi:photosystem II stability/assembly factor-like uncharacterized protein
MKDFFSCFFIALMLFVLPMSGQKPKADPPAKKEAAVEPPFNQLNLNGLKFRSVGPAITSGRIADIAVHPHQTKIWYIAVASGGVWKTENAGVTFSPLFDDQASFSTACITLDPNNPNVVWVGTGESNNQRSVAYGDGVYKSEDGGKSWKNMGLKTSEHIGKIVVDPRNSDVVYVAAYGPLWKEGGERGVYKTSDGGKTWSLSLALDEHTGASDLLMDPRNPDVLYAAVHQRRRHVFTYVGGGPGSALYKSKDGGKTWEKAMKGLPSGDLGRIGLAMAPSDPEIMYAIVEANEGRGGLYRSTDRAASWEKRSGYFTAGLYYSEIFVHPRNPHTLYAMDVWNQISNDGGKTWRMLGEQYKHVDNHALWIDPKDPEHFISGCDGGIYESWDGALTWDFKENLPVTQFYKVSVDNSRPFYYIYGGTQDNFSLGGPSRTRNEHGIQNSDWFVTQGGDGFESQVDPENPNIVYAQAQYGVLVRYDRSSGEQTGIQPKPGQGEDEYRWNWDAPLAVSFHKSSRLYFGANKLFRTDNRGDQWVAISPDLSRQIDRNTLPVMGKIQRIDAVAKHQSTSQYGAIVAFSESPLDEQLLYAGTDDGLIQVTEDGGKTWRGLESEKIPGVPERSYVNFLLASQHDPNVVYAAFNHHKYGDFKPYLFKSQDKGRTWSPVHQTLPERGSTYCIAEDHVDRDLLFVGTEFGCFVTVDGGKNWKALKAGLPTIAVRDMEIHRGENDLILGTFGRGFYVLDDYSPLRKMKPADLSAPGGIFAVKEGLVYIEALPLGLRGKSFQGHGHYTAENPPLGAVFTYYMKEEVKTLKQLRKEAEADQLKKNVPVRYPTLTELQAEQEEEAPYLLFTIRDPEGQIVRKLKAGAEKGVHRIVWDGRYAAVNPVTLSAPAFDNPFGEKEAGILAMPGDYTVTLSLFVRGEFSNLGGAVPFRLNTLGGVTLPAADRNALVQFQREAQALQRRVFAISGMLDELSNRMRHLIKAAEKSEIEQAATMGTFDRIERKTRELRISLFGDRDALRLDQPTKFALANRVDWLTGDMWRSTSAPTQMQRDALKTATDELEPLMVEVRRLLEVELKDLEQKLGAAGAPYSPGSRNE